MATQNAINRKEPATIFQAYYSATTGVVTGDGTVFTLDFDSTQCDTDSNVSGGVFTVPKNGTYMLGMNLRLAGLTAAHTSCLLQIGKAGLYLDSSLINIGQLITAAGEYSASMNGILTLSAGDTITSIVTVSGSNKTVTVVSNGSGQPDSWFYGYLINN
jgi:hypothetical protein